MKEFCMDAAGNRFRHAVSCVRLPPTQPYFQDSEFVFHEQPHRLAAKPPLLCKIADAVVGFESGVSLNKMNAQIPADGFAHRRTRQFSASVARRPSRRNSCVGLQCWLGAILRRAVIPFEVALGPPGRQHGTIADCR